MGQEQIEQDENQIATPCNTVAHGTKQKTEKQIGLALNLYKVILWILRKFKRKHAGKGIFFVYKKKTVSRNRLLAKSSICSEFEEHGKRKSRHGIVYLAHGIRYESEEKLKNIVDHLFSAIHKVAVDAKHYKEISDNQSTFLPWVRVMQKQEQVTVETWIKVANF